MAVDVGNKIAEANEDNNSFSRAFRGFGSEDECDLWLAPGSKVFVLKGQINVNLLFWKGGHAGTCYSTSRLDVGVYFSPDQIFAGATGWLRIADPPTVKLPSVKLAGNPATWGTVSSVQQFPCNAQCQQACGDPTATQQCVVGVWLNSPITLPHEGDEGA